MTINTSCVVYVKTFLGNGFYEYAFEKSTLFGKLTPINVKKSFYFFIKINCLIEIRVNQNSVYIF